MDTKIIEINEYNDSLKDIKTHLDEAFENINIRLVRLVVDLEEPSSEKVQKKIKKIFKYINDHGREAEAEYLR